MSQAGVSRVWVQVEIEPQRSDGQPVLVGGIDPDKARNAVVALYRFRLGYGPSAIFNERNPYYTAPRRLWDVIQQDYQRDPQKIRELLCQARESSIQLAATPERVAEWQSDHPVVEAAAVEMFRVSPGRDAYIAVRRTRVDKFVSDLLNSKSVRPDRVPLVEIANWLRVTPEKLSAATMGDDDAPFFSEAYLYTLLGKEAARSILTRLDTVADALGIEPWNIDRNAADDDG